jgi:hypothetical protein
MNTDTEMGRTNKISSNVLAGDLIRAEIERHPKMSTKVAAQVARNFDDLLRQLKDHEVSMHTVCRAAALGNPNDRDSKALYKYRNPEGSKPRKYITQAAKFVKLAEAIAEINDHPYSGTSSQILSRIFAGTPYSGALSQYSEASIMLKTILDEVTYWIARQVDLAKAYRQLLPPSVVSSTDSQFERLRFRKSPLHLELGYRKTVIHDNTEHPIQLLSEDGLTYELRVREDVSLFIGVDDSNVPRPFLGIRKSLEASCVDEDDRLLLWLRRERSEVDAEIYRLEDAPRKGKKTGEIIYHSSVGPLLLTEEVVSRSIDLDLLARWTKSPESSLSEANPLVWAFIASNREYSETEVAPGLEAEDINGPNSRTMPATADTLEYLEKFLSGEESSVLVTNKDVLDSSSQWAMALDSFPGSSFYGHGAIGQLISHFTNKPIAYEPNEIERKLLKLEMPENFLLDRTDEETSRIVGSLSNSPMAPAGGWIKADYSAAYGFRWSAADLLWLRTKMLVMLSESKAEKEKKNVQAGIDALLSRLKSA